MKNINYPPIKKIMSKVKVTLKSYDSILDAINIFEKHGIDSAPVVNDENKIIGFLTESDCIRCLGSYLFFDELNDISVNSFMTKEIYFLKEDSELFEVEAFFEKNRLHQAPVLDEDGDYIGIVSRRNILHALKNVFYETVEHKEEIKKEIIFNSQERLKMYLRTIERQLS